MTKKKCFKCEKTLPLSEFYAHPMMGDGHLGKCKECTKRDVMENRDKNLDKYRKYDRERFKNPARKKKIKEYANGIRDRAPEKAAARSKLHYALKSGWIKRLPCQVCGEKKAQGHHVDYSKPYDVMWLCSTHHWDQHRRESLKTK